MEHDNRNPKGDQRQPGDNAGASTGTEVKMYPYNVNGVRLSTGTEVMSAKELIAKAVAADALVTTLEENPVLADDDRMYESDDEINLSEPNIFIALPKYEGSDSVRERIRNLLPSGATFSRRRS